MAEWMRRRRELLQWAEDADSPCQFAAPDPTRLRQQEDAGGPGSAAAVKVGGETSSAVLSEHRPRPDQGSNGQAGAVAAECKAAELSQRSAATGDAALARSGDPPSSGQTYGPAPAGWDAAAASVRRTAQDQAGPPTQRLRFWTEESSPEDEEDRELVRQIRRRVFDQTEGLPPREREALARQIALEMAGRLSARARQERIVAEVLSTLGGRLGPLDPLLGNASISEILVNAPEEIYAERRGRLERQNLAFRGDREVRALVEGIAAWAGRKFDWASPVLDCHLQDGSRLAAVRWPVALRGTAVSIRKFPLMPAWDDLIAMGALPGRDRAMSPSFLRTEPYPGDVDVADFMAWAFRRRVNLVVCGGTSSGKTTFLNALMGLVSSSHRIVIIEDSAELQPPGTTHVVRLERRPPNLEGEGEVSLWALLVAALRLRPDIIVVGECRKHETAVMLEAMTTGHPGSMTTVHADSPLDALRRMVRMVRQDQPDMPSAELREYIASAVQLIVHFRRDEAHASGLRLVERVTAVDGVDDGGQFVVSDLYRWQDGRLRWTGALPAWARDEGVG